MKTLQKLADSISGKVNVLKFNGVKGYCITDKEQNEILTIEPYFNGSKWHVINRKRYEAESLYINDLRELKNIILTPGITGIKFNPSYKNPKT